MKIWTRYNREFSSTEILREKTDKNGKRFYTVAFEKNSEVWTAPQKRIAKHLIDFDRWIITEFGEG